MIEIFKDIRGIVVFMSEKLDGDMKLFSPDFELNRKRYLLKNKLDYENLFSAKLEHGANVEIVDGRGEKFIDYTDGLLTNKPGLILSVTSADCLPIFLFDPVKKVIGILHCGWRSATKGIVKEAIKRMNLGFGSSPENILVGIGPGIQKCHFEVSDDFPDDFVGSEKFIKIRDSRKYFNLKSWVENELILNGVRSTNIKIDPRCSFCENELWSYRRDGKNQNQIQAAMAGIKIIL